MPSAWPMAPPFGVTDWLGLNEARRANVLRHWLSTVAAGPVPESLVQRLLHELPQVRAGRWPLPGGDLRQHAGLLMAVPQAAAPGNRLQCLDLSQPGLHRLSGWGGALRVSARQTPAACRRQTCSGPNCGCAKGANSGSAMPPGRHAA